MNESVGLHPHKCYVCGKEFECRVEYTYRRYKKGAKGNTYDYFCSYTCMRKAQKELSPIEQRRKKTIERELRM